VAGCCECGDESPGSGAMELVRGLADGYQHHRSMYDVHLRMKWGGPT
jgi:hypothetical protein